MILVWLDYHWNLWSRAGTVLFFSWRGPIGQRVKESWFTVSCSSHISIAKCVRHMTKKHCRMATKVVWVSWRSFTSHPKCIIRLKWLVGCTGFWPNLSVALSVSFRLCEFWISGVSTDRRAKLHRNRLGSAVLTPLAGMPLVYRLLVTYHVWMFILSQLLF